MVTHSSILTWKSPWTEEPDMLSLWGCKESDTTEHARGQLTHKLSTVLAWKSNQLVIFYSCSVFCCLRHFPGFVSSADFFAVSSLSLSKPLIKY